MTNDTAYPGLSALVHKHLSKVPFTAGKNSTDAIIYVVDHRQGDRAGGRCDLRGWEPSSGHRAELHRRRHRK